ncbi:MAG: hypothetical protein E6H95_05290 [Chloroflexi bacterium]|nr:MAG: hypothetical protein E6H95_05290 [Chloroflexota bacterium]
MAVLLIILGVTIGLAIRAGLYRRRWNVADSDTSQESWLVDTYARTFVLVLLSLLGLLALGLMYGNVGRAQPKAPRAPDRSAPVGARGPERKRQRLDEPTP